MDRPRHIAIEGPIGVGKTSLAQILAERLGITAQISHKIVTRPGGLIGRVVVAGEAEIAFQQISELLSVPGLEVVGPLPPEVQVTIESATGIFADTKHPAAAQSLLDSFSTPAAAAERDDREPPASADGPHKCLDYAVSRGLSPHESQQPFLF